MALEAPSHCQGRVSIDDLHLIDAPMTLDTTDATVYVGAVIEIGVVGKFVNLDPLHWKTTLVRTANLFELWALAVNLGVTVHARLGRRNRRKCGAINGAVAVSTIEAELSHVRRVAIWNGLQGLIAHIDRLGTEPVRNDKRRIQRRNRR